MQSSLDLKVSQLFSSIMLLQTFGISMLTSVTVEASL